MKIVSGYIEEFRVQKMWGRINLHWKDLNENVNILVGINGGGKTTLLDLIYDYYTGQKVKKEMAEALNGNEIHCPVAYIRSFDIPANAKKKTESMLLQDLKSIINQNGEGTSFFDYRMKMLNYPQDAYKIKKRIELYFQIVNSLFGETGKEITIDPKNNTLAFMLKRLSGLNVVTDGTVQLEQLSSGEKQMLLILTTVFLQEGKPNILLMDEPEISLHITWQDRLIEKIRQLNPNCQLILTTHSPNIFANGWEDKIVFIEDLEEK